MITIIGILASLITVAAVGALRKAREAETKAEIDQIATAIEDYKNETTAYPPNCQTDGTSEPLDEQAVLQDLKRHIKQAFPRGGNEPPELIARLAGLTTAGGQLPAGQGLQGGMSAGEALVFWLGGFSSDPKYPLSGDGGPSYQIPSLGGSDNATLDPIESRQWTFPFDVGRLGPRDADGYFNGRFIEYTVTINGQAQTRRINFWQYTPRKSKQPYLYFDTSRHPGFDATAAEPARYDPPAATALSGLGPAGDGLHVHAIKKIHPNFTPASLGTAQPVEFVNPQKFQVLHCGLDEEWGEEAFERMSAHGVDELNGNPWDPDDYLLFPEGPFIGEVADTIVNFATGTRIEDAQP